MRGLAAQPGQQDQIVAWRRAGQDSLQVLSASVGNSGDGIESYNSLYLGNNASSNTGAGLRVIQTAEAFNDAYGQNFFLGNGDGDVVGDAFAVECNRIGTSTICPP